MANTNSLISFKIHNKFICSRTGINLCAIDGNTIKKGLPRMEVKCIFSEKGKELLVINNFKFCMGSTLSNGQVRWRCVNKKSNCLAKVYTSPADHNRVMYSDLDHNHEEDANVQRQALSNSIKRKAVNELSEKPSKLIQQELRASNLDKVASSDLKRLRKNMWSARRSAVPKTQPNHIDSLANLSPVISNENELLKIEIGKLQNHLKEMLIKHIENNVLSWRLQY